MRAIISILAAYLLCFGALSACKKKKEQEDDRSSLVPVINIMIPNTGLAGDVVKLIGENFGQNKQAVQVNFNNQAASIISMTSTEISVMVPPLVGKVEVGLSIDNQTSNKLAFSYKAITEDFAKKDKDKIAELMKGNEPIVWIFTGNSITQGAKHTHGLRPYPEIFGERVRWELGRTEDCIINTAISGHTAKNILDDFEWRIAQFQPKVVSVMVGTNDAATGNNITTTQFRNNINQLILKIRNVGAIPIFLSPNKIITLKAPERSRLAEYLTIAREISRLEGVIFVDNWTVWNTEMEDKYKNEVNKYLLNDPLHPNGLGHKEIAITLFKELSIYNPVEPSCGGIYYEGEH